MKINKINNTQFQKKLIANASVQKNNNPEKVYIYKLEYDTDEAYFQKLKNDKCWENNNYLSYILVDFAVDQRPCDYFISMEDEKGNVLGISEITSAKNSILLDFLETAPKYSINNKGKRTFKYIGETMLGFIALLCKIVNKRLEIPDIADSQSARDFYFKNCGFTDTGLNGARMSEFDDFIARNEHHTGSSIEIIG